MKSFNFHSVKNVKEATKLASGRTSYLAGGMTTLPAVKLGLASYSDVIDIKKIKELTGIKPSSKSLKIGATTKHVEVAESKTEEKKETSKPKTKAEKKQEAKQKAATTIVKKMGDKGRYDDSNQIKTLVVMQVLGDTKSFFDNQLTLQDTPGFFDSTTVPDAVISNNNYAQYLMFGGSDAAHNALTESQYR